MQTQSPELAAALVAGRQWITSTVEVIEGGGGPTAPAIATLYPDGGSVSNDETRASHRTCGGLQIGINEANADLIPGAVGELLHPATGNELRIRSGRKFTRTNLLSPGIDDLSGPGIGRWIGTAGANAYPSRVATIGTGSLAMVCPAAPNAEVVLDRTRQVVKVAPGSRISVSARLRATAAGRNMVVGVHFWTITGATAGNAEGLPTLDSTGGWTTVSGEALVVPNNAAACTPYVACADTPVAGELHLVNAVKINYGPKATAWDSGEELNACGVFRFDKLPVVDTAGSLSMTVAGLDRAFAISQARWTDAFRVPKWTLIPDAIAAILADRWVRSTPLVFDASACAGHPVMTMTVPNSILGTDQTNADPWADCVTFATAGGCELYVDEVGRVVMRPFVDPTENATVATYNEGVDSTLVDTTREIDATRTFSGIVVTGGNGTDKACRAVVWNRNPASPTYVGKVGKIPAFFDSPLLRTIGQCQLVGEGLLRRIQLSSEVVTFTAVPNPGLETADAVHLSRARAKATGVYGVSNYTLPLDRTSAMSLTTRSTTDIPGDTIT